MDASLAPYHRQHQELLRLAREQEALLAPAAVRSHPDLCLEVLRRLVTQLKAHVAMEDTVLYPALYSVPHGDTLAAVQTLAIGLHELKHRVHHYSHHWASAETIRQAPEAFIGASRDLLQTLRQRIQEEEAKLFPLVDQS